jgi:single-stranded DNA-binding protein
MSMQQLIVLGRAVKDGEVLASKEGKNYGKFSVAVNEYLGAKKEERTSFYNVLVFNKTHDKTDKIKKGDYVMVEGRPETDAYINNDGEAKANLVVFANRWKLLK